MAAPAAAPTANVLEDLGWYVVDNLPPQLLSHLAELRDERARNREARLQRLAVVVDVRAGGCFAELEHAIGAARARRRARPRLPRRDRRGAGAAVREVRRPHPLQGDGRLLDGIQRERELLLDLRSTADVVIDSSGLNVHQLSAELSVRSSPATGACSCASPSCRSGSSTACRSTPTSSSTCASCPTLLGPRAARPDRARPAGQRVRACGRPGADDVPRAASAACSTRCSTATSARTSAT